MVKNDTTATERLQDHGRGEKVQEGRSSPSCLWSWLNVRTARKVYYRNKNNDAETETEEGTDDGLALRQKPRQLGHAGTAAEERPSLGRPPLQGGHGEERNRPTIVPFSHASRWRTNLRCLVLAGPASMTKKNSQSPAAAQVIC